MKQLFFRSWKFFHGGASARSGADFDQSRLELIEDTADDRVRVEGLASLCRVASWITARGYRFSDSGSSSLLRDRHGRRGLGD